MLLGCGWLCAIRSGLGIERRPLPCPPRRRMDCRSGRRRNYRAKPRRSNDGLADQRLAGYVYPLFYARQHDLARHQAAERCAFERVCTAVPVLPPPCRAGAFQGRSRPPSGPSLFRSVPLSRPGQATTWTVLQKTRSANALTSYGSNTADRTAAKSGFWHQAQVELQGEMDRGDPAHGTPKSAVAHG